VQLLLSSEVSPIIQRVSCLSSIHISPRIARCGAAHLLTLPRPASCDSPCFFGRSGVRAPYCRGPLHSHCSCSVAEAANLADATATSRCFFSRDRSRPRLMPMTTSDTEYEIALHSRRRKVCQMVRCMDCRSSPMFHCHSLSHRGSLPRSWRTSNSTLYLQR